MGILHQLEWSPDDMLKAACHLNLTLDVPTTEHLERISDEHYLRPTSAGRILFLQRLALESAGWKIDDKDLGGLLEIVCRLPKGGIEELEQVIRKFGAKDEKAG